LITLYKEGRNSFDPLFQKGKKFPQFPFFKRKLFVAISVATIGSRHLPVIAAKKSGNRGQRIRNEKQKKPDSKITARLLIN
jgi:hypothetical protein